MTEQAPAPKKKRDAQQTKERILDAAESLFSARGYHGVSIKDIAGQVGIAKATVMHHFKSKRTLYSGILARAFRDLDHTTQAFDRQARGAEAIRNLLSAYFKWVMRNPTTSKLLVRAQLDNPEQSKSIARKYYNPMMAKMAEHFQEGVADGTVNAHDARHFMFLFAGGITNFVVCLSLFHNIVNQDRTLSDEQVTADYEKQVNAIIADSLRP